MRGPRKFCQGRRYFENVFFKSLMRGGRVNIPVLAGYDRNASVSLCADDGPTLNIGSVAL